MCQVLANRVWEEPFPGYALRDKGGHVPPTLAGCIVGMVESFLDHVHGGHTL